MNGSSLNGEDIIPTDSDPLHVVSTELPPEPPSDVVVPPTASPVNDSIQQLSPFFEFGCRIFLDVCSGVSKPISAALRNLNRTVLAIDLLLHSSMNLLNDEFFEQLLRLCGSGLVAYCATAPNCGLYSLLRLRPGGPRALRTPSELDGVAGLSADEAMQLQESSLLFDRCAECACITHLSGGHAHVEQPSGAMSWREPMAKKWLLQSSCNLVVVAACEYGLDIYKNWLFASSYTEFASLAKTCSHAAKSHRSIAGARGPDGAFLSKQSAEYPPMLASSIADVLAPLISAGSELQSVSMAMDQVRVKDVFAPPFAHEDGGGCVSKPDWSLPPPNVDNIFKSIRDEFFPALLHHDMPKRILAHFAQRLEHCPIPDILVTKLRDILSSRIPGLSDSSWSIRDDQPLYLEALHKVSLFMQDPDIELFPSLIAGVSTGFDGEIPPSNVFHIKDAHADSSSNFRPDLSIHLENWKSAEDRPEVVDDLVADELQKGWIYKFDGSVEEAKTTFPLGLAIGKLGLAITDSRPPRLVVDSTVCGTNGNCIINEHQCMPSAKDVLRTFPLRNNRHELSALGLDVRAAHKRVVIKESHRGLLGFSHRNSLYFYKVAPFGAVFSAHWWGRLGSFWVRFLHQAIFVAHALFLFVDDFLLIQRKDILPLTAAFVCSLMQVFGLPISWRKADLHCALDWIGWRFNFGIGAIYLQERKRSKLLELISQMLSHPRIAKKTLEKFLGLALWITQIFPQMRSSLHYLFSDLHRPPGTQYSVDPGYWPITISCLTDTLQFSTRPAGTAIPAGSKLISVRHQPVKTLTDVHNARLTEKRIWVRVMDPTSSRRSLSLDSKRVLQTYEHWLQHSPPIRSLYPLQNWSGEAAADACASGPMCQIGGYLKSPSGRFTWFSQRWSPKDFSSLGITVSEDMQRDISCYEALAQLALLFVASRMWPSRRFNVRISSWSDNSGAESGVNKLFTTSYPLCVFLERLSLLSATCFAELDATHISGPSNELADALSRWDTISLPPYGFSPTDRCEFSLQTLWFPKSEITVHPPNVSLSWPLPG